MPIISSMFNRYRRSEHLGTEWVLMISISRKDLRQCRFRKITLIEKLVKPGTTLRYATFDSLFDIIKEVHEEGLKHGCRDILNKKLQTMCANIFVKQIEAFVRYVRLKRAE